MAATLNQANTEPRSTTDYSPELPPRMRVLYITTRQRTGAWLAEALRADSAVQVELEEALAAAAGLARLRDEIFDVVLVSHLPGELDALELIAGYRAGGAEEPILVLGAENEEEMAPLCYQAGADGYLSVHAATTLNLLWVIARAVERHQLLRESLRLKLAEQSRMQREHDEARRLLAEQRALIRNLQDCSSFCAQGDSPCTKSDSPIFADHASMVPAKIGTVPNLQPPDAKAPETAGEAILPPQLFTHYKELLRTYIIMGSGSVGDELKRLADLLVQAGVGAGETMHLHLTVLEELLHGLGSRSSRHIMNRADLLVLELTTLLAERYRRLYQEQAAPPQQMMVSQFR
jgi:DNA-binding NarL/FixJ family response regulator